MKYEHVMIADDKKKRQNAYGHYKLHPVSICWSNNLAICYKTTPLS